MNTKLLEALKANDQKEIVRLLQESGVADSELAKELNDVVAISAIQTTCAYIMRAIGNAGKEDKSWSGFFNGAILQVGIDDIEKNPSTPTFVQTMMLVAYALAKGD